MLNVFLPFFRRSLFMKKLFLLLTCLGITAHMHGMLSDEVKHTHTIEIKFTVNATPKSPEDWNKLEELFTQFLDHAQNTPDNVNALPQLDNVNALPQLMDDLKVALENVPEVCKSRGIEGSVGTSLHSFGEVAPELISA